MRAAICVRVSPRPQDKVRYSPEIQEGKCREWCVANGHEIVTVVQDILVSGGAANRFDSIFAALDRTPADLCVVSDLSRWTRDDPERFWFIKKVLTDRGVRLYSVDEPWLGSDMPFSATVTTATVESNARQRDEIKRKTSEGVRRALAAGKWFGRPRFGWTWHPETREWSQDVPLIRALYEAWNTGESATSIARRFNLRPGGVRARIASRAQRQIVGDDVWLRAQARPLGERAARGDAKWGNPYRGMLTCPFCGSTLQHHHNAFYSYICPDRRQPHPWRTLTVRRYVTPAVQQALSGLRLPDDEAALLAQPPETEKPHPARNVQAELDRLAALYVRGRISEPRYERMAAELEAERDAVPLPPRPLPERIEIVRTLDILDFDDRAPEGGTLLNRLLREVVMVRVAEDRAASVTVNPAYSGWLVD